jgi:lipopolysaccharide transport system ATP-binding protein
MSSDDAIQVRGLGKRYLLGESKRNDDSFRDLLASTAKSLFRRTPRDVAAGEFWALRDLSFDIRHGENVGIICLNGAGKSTLLKILSRITVPTLGTARIAGRLGALLEVGTGFSAELTGRENVFLYGSILGMRREEVRRKLDAIVEFSGISKFINTPVKRYSSGMYVRLAFAVATHLEPDILLLDEVLAVGDLAFQRKCIDHAKELQKRDATILFVSHNMFSIKTMCDRVICLRAGEVQYDGAVEAGIAMYEKDCRMTALPWVGSKPEEWQIYVRNYEVLDDKRIARTIFDFGERITLRMTYDTRGPVNDPNFIIALIRSDGVPVCNYSTEADAVETGCLNGVGTIELTLPPLKLVSAMYTISIVIREKGFQQVLSGQVLGTFHSRHHLFDSHFGVFHESAKWQFSSVNFVSDAAQPQSMK